jgi:FkbM family methyltransferase
MMESPYELMQLEKDRSVLMDLHRLGFSPTCIYDVGAGHGLWTRTAAEVFPDASFQMFEPLASVNADYEQGLQTTLESKINCTLHRFALGEKAGEFTIGIGPDPRSSSLLIEQESSYFPTCIKVPVVSIDEGQRSHHLPQPQMLKMDTQGYEFSILKGAVETLKHLEVILLESWLTRAYGPNTPLLMEVANWLALHGFFLFDFSGSYRIESNVLIAQDAFFIKHPSPYSGTDQDRSYRPITEIQSESSHELQTQLQQTQSELEQIQAELQQTRTELRQARMEAIQSQNEMIAMKSSKFWKMRSSWFRAKQFMRMGD